MADAHRRGIGYKECTWGRAGRAAVEEGSYTSLRAVKGERARAPAMFWRVSTYAQPSPVEALLDKGSPDLEELLALDELLQVSAHLLLTRTCTASGLHDWSGMQRCAPCSLHHFWLDGLCSVACALQDCLHRGASAFRNCSLSKPSMMRCRSARC